MRDTSLDEFLDDGDDSEESPNPTDDPAVDAGADPGEAADGSPEPTDAAGPEAEATEEGAATQVDPTEDEDATGIEGARGEEGTVTDAEATDPSAVEPAVSTSDWTPSGAACEACGAVVERRWRDDGRLVCEACKAW